ncbi:Nitrogen permease regulator-like 3 [Chytridiales sp. JEL 0842]|nr:Nitrogen permease regulator-like 3 [Chytridiales sp. JEL 0842]
MSSLPNLVRDEQASSSPKHSRSGWMLLGLVSLYLTSSLYAILLSKWLPTFGNPILDFIKHDQHYCYLLPILPPVLLPRSSGGTDQTMDGTLGIILVCYSSRGHQLVFNYPWPCAVSPQTAAARSRNIHNRPSSIDPSIHPQRERGFQELRSLDVGSERTGTNLEGFLGFDLHFLSDILSPKVALCDKQFQLTVDDVTFVGHPTLLNADRPGTGHRFARMIQRKRLADLRKLDSVVHDHDGEAHDEAHTSFGSDLMGSGRRVGGLDRSKSKHSVTGVNPQLTMFNLVLAVRPSSKQGFGDAVEAIYRHMIAKVTAALNLEELATTLNCPLAQVYKLAAHLVYWRKAKIHDVIHPRNVYVVSKNADLTILPPLEQEFHTRIQGLDLGAVLSSLSAPKPYSSIFHSRDAKPSYMEVLACFLRNDLVVQLRMSIYLLIPARIRYQKIEGDQGDDDPLILVEPGEATDVQKDWINTIALHQPPPIATLFLRLVRYFNGHFHMEEIIFRESIIRKDFKLILTRYSEFLLVVHK